MVNMLARNAIYFFLPLFLSLIITPFVRHFAFRLGIVSYPRPNRWHKKPTALLGGVGIYLAAVISALLLGLVTRDSIGLFLGATLLFACGIVDDKFTLKPYIKLFFQLIAGCIVIFLSKDSIGTGNSFIFVPLFLLWIVGITNAFNLLDNIDGLAVGIAAISAGMLFISSIIFMNNGFGPLALVLAGAALGFLPYNFNPAKIFMGDSGSMFLGFSLAVISVSGPSRQVTDLIITMLVPVLILSVPIFDTIFVMIIRSLQGRKIFEGGKDHTSHHLVFLGVSPRKTVVLLYVISIIFGLIALSYSKINFFVITIIAFLCIVILLFFGMFLFEGTSYRLGATLKKASATNNKTVLNSLLFHKKRILEVLLDFFFVCIAYYLAYVLRFENTFIAGNLFLLNQSMLWIIVIKMSTFFLFGLYQGEWRYISVPDFLRIFKVVSLASVFSILFITFAFRFKDYSRAVFFIDWMLLLMLITGSRFLFRIIDEFFSRLEYGGKKVLIYGAGDSGEMVLREIKRNKTLNYSPVGYIDDNPHKKGAKIHGIPVLGGREQIERLVRLEGVQELIVAIPSFETRDFEALQQLCAGLGIQCKKVRNPLD